MLGYVNGKAVIMLLKGSKRPLMVSGRENCRAFKSFCLDCCGAVQNMQALAALCSVIMIYNFLLASVCLALRRWWDQWQPATVGAEEHHHHLSLLRREWHLSAWQFHQLPRAAFHQHQHSDQPGQHVPTQQGPVPTGTQGRKVKLESIVDNIKTQCSLLHYYLFFGVFFFKIVKIDQFQCF